MLQELGAQTGGGAWAVASMLFFIVVYVVVTVRALRARRDVLDAHARLALDGDGGHAQITSDAGMKG